MTTSKKEVVQAAIGAGLLPPVRRGRPRVYQTEEERKTAYNAQAKAGQRRYKERVRRAYAFVKSLQVVEDH